MKKSMVLILILNIVLLCSCIKAKVDNIPESTITNYTESNSAENFKINLQEYTYFKNQTVTGLSDLVKAEWNEEGDGIKIFCLNDIAEYDDGQIFEFKYEDESLKKFCLGEVASAKSRQFIDSINKSIVDDKSGGYNVLKKYEVKDLVITLYYANSTEIKFTGIFE